MTAHHFRPAPSAGAGGSDFRRQPIDAKIEGMPRSALAAMSSRTLRLIVCAAIGCATTGEPAAEAPRTTCEAIGLGPPAHHRVRFENRMGGGFTFRHVALAIDGKPLGSDIEQAKTDARVSSERIVTYDLTMPSGCHRVTVHVDYQGNGSGVFAYLKQYRFAPNSSYAFDAVEGGLVSIVAYEQGTATTPLEERPALRFTELSQM